MKTKNKLCINRRVRPIQSKKVMGLWVVDAPHYIKGTCNKTLVLRALGAVLILFPIFVNVYPMYILYYKI